jgi:hypothetical protein
MIEKAEKKVASLTIELERVGQALSKVFEWSMVAQAAARYGELQQEKSESLRV